MWLFEHITDFLTVLLGKNTIYHRKNMDSKLIHITNCKTCKNISFVVEYAILIRYYYETAKTRALYESIDGPADNVPNSDGLGDFHRNVPKLTVHVY